MEKLTIQEEEVMIYIWELQDCFVKDIVSKFPQPAPPYTTVASIVKNLERKGYVKSKHIGNTYQYTPAIRENEYKRHFMSGVVRNYFENSYKEMVSFFAKHRQRAMERPRIPGTGHDGKGRADYRIFDLHPCIVVLSLHLPP